jgi:threonine dehydratase
MANLPTVEDVRRAASCLEGKAYRTPLLESPLLNEKLGCRLLVKPETLQRTGSFKFRGAYNKIFHIPVNKRKNGIVAFSSGNHAQGVAAAAKIFGIETQIIMPKDAPAIKVANTRSYGAQVLFYDRFKEDRSIIGEKLVKENGATLVHPYDDSMIVAGQGTVGLEVARQAQAMDANLNAFLAPCGGGGLISGCALALETESPETEIYSAEPVGFEDTALSVAAGERLVGKRDRKSICDALLSPKPGKITYEINARLLKSGLTINDETVIKAMKVAFNYFKLVVEPGGAAALAAVLSEKYKANGKTVAVVLSGGNVDAKVYRKALDED